MTEELPLAEESVPSTEPMATSGLPEADKKRVLVGSAIGGGIFLGVLITIIVLVSTEDPKPKPTPPKPITKYPHPNPYFVDAFVTENERLITISLVNNRKQLEENTEYSEDMPGYVPIVKDTDENAETPRLQVVVSEYDEHLVRISYLDPEFPRWTVPYYGNHSDPYAQAAQYSFHNSGFKLHDNVNNSFQWHYTTSYYKQSPLISTRGCRLQYFDKYIEFEALLERDFIYGMGERIESFYLKNDNYSLWNRYMPYTVDGDTENGMYSSHPFILNRLMNSERGDFIGIFMRNSNAMLFSMWDNINNGTFINYKMIGGIIDIYLFHTADPQYILRKYHSVIGRPYLPPLWAMGLQQARANYTVKEFETIISKHHEHGLPIDALWADSGMNVNYATFTVNTDTFAGIKDLVKKMHDIEQGIDMHFVANANPALQKSDNYKYYLEALKAECLIMSAAHFNSPYEGYSSPGTSVWLDFFLYNATLIWAGGLQDLHELTEYDGIWISENEINNYCSGECFNPTSDAEGNEEIPNPFHNTSEFNYIQYRPTLDPLESETLPMAAYHFGDDMFYKQYFTHNLFGLQISQATFEALYGIFEDKRFLIASRSTWPGSGQFASHWLDGNYATWESLQSSIAGVLNFNMFGIPHVGAPIGGYFGNCSEELLARWFELGAFYPLMLSYSSTSLYPKEAYTYPDYIPYIRNALIQRYGLIRFMYTKMFEAFLWGGSVVHPLFFDFPTEKKLYEREIVDRTFMWASTLYVIPSLAPNQHTIKAYLPNWRWYDLRTYEIAADYIASAKEGNYYLFDQPVGYITVLIKGGSIVPYQHLSGTGEIMNTKDLDTIPAQIIIAPDHTGKATGSMVVDAEGIRPYPDPKSNTYRHYTFTYMNQIFRINMLSGFTFHGDYKFDFFYELVILDNFGKYIVDFVCMMDMNMRKKQLQFRQETASSLVIHDETDKKVSMYSLESIVWGSLDQHDFCRFQAYLSKITLTNNLREMSGTLETADPDSYRLKFDLTARALNDYIVYLEIAKNEGFNEWRVPDVVDQKIKTEVKATKSLDGVGFGTSKESLDFYFEMSDEDDPQDFLLTTRNQPFVYVRNFIQVKFMVTGRHIFGLGERVGKFELADGVYSIWNYDAMHDETGEPPGNNMYSSHPFYMIHTHNPKDFAGVFFLTSNPMDVKIKHIGMQTELDHILSGGVIELFLIGKGSAEKVLREYHFLIGKPTPLPFWAFGYHQSRWGYRDITHLKQVISKFDDLPLDGIWMDKDFMVRYKSFTVDTKKWFGLKEFVADLHNKKKHFVAIVDAAIAQDDTYSPYVKGEQRQVFIKSSFTKEPLIGITWAGYSVWVDFLSSGATTFWVECLTEFYGLVEFDGLWLDMNEPSNFCDGECPDHLSYHYYFFPLDYYDDLYYNPTHRPIEDNSISVEALHAGDEKLANEFNYHNMYGHYQSKASAKFFTDVLNKRPFIISSSTFPGTGRYAAHWLGDNQSSWTSMEYSIPGMFNFNMFGIPFVGANICGYEGNATDQLCARWIQMGAFYPFMRNHNSPESSPQEPYLNDVMKTAFKKSLQARYSIARYLYSEYMHTVLRGGPLIRPLIFEFSTDSSIYSTLENSFMVGPALRVTPVMQEDIDELQAYFPNEDWYSFVGPKYEKVMSYDGKSTEGKKISVHSSLNTITSVHIRGGSIFPIQEATESTLNILQLHDMPINLIVAPNHNFTAVGELLYDSEHHTNYIQDHQDVFMFLNDSTITLNITSGKALTSYTHTDKFVSKVIILGAEKHKDAKSAKYETLAKQTVNMKAPVYNSEYKTLTLEVTQEKSMSILDVGKISWSTTA